MQAGLPGLRDRREVWGAWLLRATRGAPGTLPVHADTHSWVWHCPEFGLWSITGKMATSVDSVEPQIPVFLPDAPAAAPFRTAKRPLRMLLSNTQLRPLGEPGRARSSSLRRTGSALLRQPLRPACEGARDKGDGSRRLTSGPTGGPSQLPALVTQAYPFSSSR